MTNISGASRQGEAEKERIYFELALRYVPASLLETTKRAISLYDAGEVNSARQIIFETKTSFLNNMPKGDENPQATALTSAEYNAIECVYRIIFGYGIEPGKVSSVHSALCYAHAWNRASASATQTALRVYAGPGDALLIRYPLPAEFLDALGLRSPDDDD